MDNWLQFCYLFIALGLLTSIRLFSAPLQIMTVIILTNFYFLATVFFFSKTHFLVTAFATLNRILSRIVPMLMFYMPVLYREGITQPRWLTENRALA